MNFKKWLAVAVAAAAFVSMPLSVGAKGVGNSHSAAASAAVAQQTKQDAKATVRTDRAQIKEINASIVAEKKEIRSDLSAIAKDVAGIKAFPALSSGSDYQTVKTNITQIKSLIQQANTLEYRKKLSGARGSGATDAALQQVILMMKQKKTLLDQALTLADSTKTIADSIVSQKAAQVAAYDAFKASAAQLKQTIDQNHQQIESVNDQISTLLSQIVATYSTNQNILSSNAQGLSQVLDEFNAAKTELSQEYNGQIAAAEKQYETYRKSGDYEDALKELQTINSLQQDRIKVVEDVLSKLQKTLADLNALVSNSGSSSSGTQG